MHTYQVQLKEPTRESLREFQQEAAKFAEVPECHHMTGAIDFLLKIVVKDMSSYNEFTAPKNIFFTEKAGTAKHLLQL